MASHNIKVMTCDRCGKIEEIRRHEQEYSWASLNYSEVNGHRWIGSKRVDKPRFSDLCPTCSKAFYDWFKLERIEHE